MADLPAPKFSLVNWFKALVDKVINLGEEAAIASVTAAQPWLGWPVISFIFKSIVGVIADAFEGAIDNGGTKLIIKLQNRFKTGVADEAVAELKKDQENPNVDPAKHAEDLAAAKAAIDANIRRGD